MRLLCYLGLHRWHPTHPLFETRRLSKLICTRCNKRKWWKQPA